MYSLPVVTVVIATLNSERTLKQCIDSVINQTYTQKKLIVIDGGSIDLTLSIINEHIDYIDYFVSESDKGIYHAWNKGLIRASGEWVCFLGSDDYFYHDKALSNMMEYIVKKVPDEVDIVYGNVMRISPDRQDLQLMGEEWEQIKEKFNKLMCIPHPAVFHRRNIFEKYGLFDESFRIAGDYEMLLRVLKNGKPYSLLSNVVVAMREGGLSSKSENTFLSLKEMRRAQKMHGQIIINRLLLSLLVKQYLYVSYYQPIRRFVAFLGKLLRG